MDKGIMELINKIPGWENKIPYQGAFTVKPFGRMAGRPVKCVVPGKDKVLELDKVLDAVELKDGIDDFLSSCAAKWRFGDAKSCSGHFQKRH